MKKLILIILFSAVTTATAQNATDSSSSKKTLFTKKSWELSLMGSFNNQSITSDSPIDDITTLSFSVSPAYYIYDGLSLEPEFTALVIFSDGVGYGADYQLLINIGYTFPTTKQFHPYIKAGYGIGDITTQYYVGTQTSAIGSERVDEFVQCINSGVGIKWVIGSNAAIKTELNYRVQQYSYVPNNGGLFENGSGNEKNVSIHHFGLLLGMSTFL